MRLDRFICKHTEYSQKQARYLVVTGRVSVNGQVVRERHHAVTPFCSVWLDQQRLQQRQAHYLMLHKPAGYLSATTDPSHPTVMALMPAELREQLHIAGRLDLQTTGLLVLTNDGRWSRLLTEPSRKQPKVYRVETLWPISPESAAVFARGVHLLPEDIVTQPAQLEQLSSHTARLTIYEGRYHQVKRMFQQVDNMVIALHRESVGDIELDAGLAPGESRPLTAGEVAAVTA